ncbi:PIN domain-containing protein [Okeania sp. SIO2B3]|uniref:PIN domain-containing protein n=1 Tax=Okeania sp. SIO2B3 TaxID=2607784 RepID=UPI0025D0CDB0|nr:PIN domain-containing protein [Okeania sp. SIO2B3]
MNIVLDACAVIAFFRDESGAEKVEKYLSDSQYNSLIHAINMCEVYYDFWRSEGEEVRRKLFKICKV